jgi:hypothetical protein
VEGFGYRVPVLSGPLSGTASVNFEIPAMQSATFRLGLKAVAAVTPYAKKLTDDEIGFLYLTMPKAVKDAVSDEMWAFACSQYRLDPSPNKEMPLDVQLLSYVYRVRSGRPAFDWGLKEDLPQRMASADRFHQQALTEAQGKAPELPPTTNPLMKVFF